MILPIATGGIGNIDLSSGQLSRSKSKSDEKESDTFASLMDMNAMDSSDTAVVPQDRKSINQKDMDADDINAKPYHKPKTADKVDDVKPAEDLSDKDNVEALSQLMEKLKEFVLDELGITDEELTNYLSDLNMNLMDLTELSNFKELVLASRGYSNVDVLINEELSDFVTDAMTGMEQFLQENNIHISDDFIKLINSMMKEDIKAVMMTGDSDEEDGAFAKQNTQADIQTENVQTTAEYNKSVASVDNAKESYDFLNNPKEYKSEAQNFNQENMTKNVVNNLNQAINNAFENGISGDMDIYSASTTEADIIRQVIDDIKVNATKEINSIEVLLNPESLGKVHINVTAKEGIITAKIYAENEMARHAIENNMSALRESFNNQEIKVEKIEVMLTSYEFFRDEDNQDLNHKSKDGKSGIKGNVITDRDDIPGQEKESETDVMLQQGATVSYSV